MRIGNYCDLCHSTQNRGPRSRAHLSRGASPPKTHNDPSSREGPEGPQGSLLNFTRSVSRPSAGISSACRQALPGPARPPSFLDIFVCLCRLVFIGCILVCLHWCHVWLQLCKLHCWVCHLIQFIIHIYTKI